MHLLTDVEKMDMKHTVEVIVDLGLSFVQLQSADGTYLYKVDPDIEFLGEHFSDKQGKQMSYWSKQAIAREVELEKMRRAKPKVAESEASISKTQSSKELPNHLQRLMPKAIKPSLSKPTDVVSC